VEGFVRLPLLLIACCLLVGSLNGLVRAADAPDLSTPRQAAKAFIHGLDDGSADEAKLAAIGSGDDYKILDTLISFLNANRQLRAAAVSRFGEDGKCIPDEEMMSFTNQFMTNEERPVDDQTATVGRVGERDPMRLKRIGSEWKVDLTGIPGKRQILTLVPKVQAVLVAIAADITADKFASADQAKKALNQRIFDIAAQELEGRPGEPK
jgi:hypothetical protein